MKHKYICYLGSDGRQCWLDLESVVRCELNGRVHSLDPHIALYWHGGNIALISASSMDAVEFTRLYDKISEHFALSPWGPRGVTGV